MTAVLHPHHSVRCLPEVNPELAQAIVQTDISGPVEATHHLVQHDVPVSMDQPSNQEVNLPSHAGSLMDNHNNQVDSNSQVVSADEVPAVQDPAAGMVSITDSSLATQNPEEISSSTPERPISTTQYQQGQ